MLLWSVIWKQAEDGGFWLPARTRASAQGSRARSPPHAAATLLPPNPPQIASIKEEATKLKLHACVGFGAVFLFFHTQTRV